MKRIQKSAAAVIVEEVNIATESDMSIGYWAGSLKGALNDSECDPAAAANKLQEWGAWSEADASVVSDVIAKTLKKLQEKDTIVPKGKVAKYINEHLNNCKEELVALYKKYEEDREEILSKSLTLTPDDCFQEPKKVVESSVSEDEFEDDDEDYDD